MLPFQLLTLHFLKSFKESRTDRKGLGHLSMKKVRRLDIKN